MRTISLSSPSPLSWLVPRWLVLRIRICRASALSPIMARRLRIRHPSRWSWRQSKRCGSFPRKSPIKALYVCTHLFRRYPGVVASQQFGAGPSAGSTAADVVPLPVQGSRSPRRVRAAVRTPHGRTLGAPRKRLRLSARLRCGDRRRCRSARSPAARHQRNRRADDRDPPGCRRPSNPRSARPSPRSPSRRCSACSSRRRTSKRGSQTTIASADATYRDPG